MKRTWFALAGGRWILLTTIGLSAGIAGALVLGEPIGRLVGMMLVTPVLTCLVGAVLGGAQAVDLRSRLRGMGPWVAATTLGGGLGLAAGAVAVEQGGHLLAGHAVRIVELTPAMRALSFLVLGLIAGTAMGTAQWLVIRRSTLRVKHWIRVTALGLAIAFSASSLIVDAVAGGIASPIGLLSFVLLAGVVFGAITSRPLRRAV